MIKNKTQLDLSTSGSGYVTLSSQQFDIKHECWDFISQATTDTFFADPVTYYEYMNDGTKYVTYETVSLQCINPSSMQTSVRTVDAGTVIEFFYALKRGYGTDGWIVYDLYDGDDVSVNGTYYRHVAGTDITGNAWDWEDGLVDTETTHIYTGLYSIIQDNIDTNVLYITNYSTYQNRHKKHGVRIECDTLTDFEATYGSDPSAVLEALAAAMYT
mgnify:CR=1 FL=1